MYLLSPRAYEPLLSPTNDQYTGQQWPSNVKKRSVHKDKFNGMNPEIYILLVPAHQSMVLHSFSSGCGKLHYHCCFLSLAGVLFVLSFSTRDLGLVLGLLIHAAHPIQTMIDNLHHLPFNFFLDIVQQELDSFLSFYLHSMAFTGKIINHEV